MHRLRKMVFKAIQYMVLNFIWDFLVFIFCPISGGSKNQKINVTGYHTLHREKGANKNSQMFRKDHILNHLQHFSSSSTLQLPNNSSTIYQLKKHILFIYKILIV